MTKQISLLFNNSSDSVAGDIMARAMKLRRLNAQLLELLPDELAPHCYLLNVRDKTLVIAADNSIWAAKLKLHTAEFLDTLNAHSSFSDIIEIKCCVRPLQQPL